MKSTFEVQPMITAATPFRIYVCLMLFVCAPLLSGCGSSGGGGDDFIGAGVVSISCSPSKIDGGDRTRVTIHIRDTHPDGIALKIFFPHGLMYVQNSSRLLVDDAERRITPDEHLESQTGVFLVYYIAQRVFGDRNRGTIILELQGSGRIKDGVIGVDVDVDDPLIDNEWEFDIENPQYESESETRIEVLG
ncbi:MAG: hypothetical protein GX589_07125 [Deltaproteobacteria bacterium]|nr:hypothetical protein [Deltaproteobacteria bacterium]